MEHGIIETTEYDNGVVYCDVKPIRAGTIYPELPILKPQSGFVQVPKEGDLVAVDELKGGKRFITDVISNTEASPDTMKEGDMAIQLDEGTILSFKRNSSGDYDIKLSASGEIVVDSDKVQLGGNSGTKVVARKGDTVETNDPLTGTNTGNITSGASNTEAK